MNQLRHCFKVFLVLLVFMSLASCECDRTVCPPFSETGKVWINSMDYIYGDTLKFCNDSGDCIEFYKHKKEFSSPKQPTCEEEKFRCYCDNQCSVSGTLEYLTDSSINDYRSIYINYNEQSGQTSPPYAIFASVFNFMCWYHSQMILSPGDSFLSTLNLNNHSYQNVYAMHVDTLQFPDLIIWKTYFSESAGLIGFWRKSSGLYVRQ